MIHSPFRRRVVIAILVGMGVLVAPEWPVSSAQAHLSSQSSPKDGPKIAWIRLHGCVGLIEDESEFFTAKDFSVAVDEAEKRKCTVVVLDIESPGGRVDTMGEIIKRIVDAQSRGITFVALVRDAGSAAAMITMACREILVAPSARIGAAVTIAGGQSLKKLLDDDPELAAKFASFDDALPRGAAEQAGRSGAIVDAMRHSEAELWFCPESGLSSKRQSDSSRCIDDSKKVLTLSASEVVAFRIGRAVASDALNDKGVRQALKLPPGRSEDLSGRMETTSRRLASLTRLLQSKTGGQSVSPAGIAKTRSEINRIHATP